MPDKKNLGISAQQTPAKGAQARSINSPIIKIADVPNAPTSVVGTDVGTNRAYNNGAVSVAFTPDSTYWPATSFTASSNPSGITATGSASPIVVSGLTSGTSYAFTVTGTNSAATSVASTASSAVTATTVPQTPTIGTFTDGGTGTSGTLSFIAGATGGSSITGYKFSTDGTNYSAASGTTSPLTLSGLTPGSYTFNLKATNANGDSTASTGVSGTVIDPSAFVSIATVNLSSGSSTTISFTSIPQTYKHLQLRFLSKTTTAGTSGTDFGIQFNSDTAANYNGHQLYGDGASAAAGVTAGTVNAYIAWVPKADLTNIFAAYVTDILDYTNTNKNKTIRSLGGWDANGSGYAIYRSSQWRSTAAISRIDITLSQDSFAQYSSWALYGVKG